MNASRHLRLFDFVLSNYRWAWMLLSVLAIVFQAQLVQAFNFQNCEDCHAEVLNSDWTRKYLHAPFIERQCEKCHANKVSSIQPKRGADKGFAAGQVAQRKIQWLLDSAMEDTSHAFLLLGDKLGDYLVVEVHATDDKVFRQEITLPSLEDLVEVEDSGKSPTISDVEVLKVETGLFVSATIGWQTDSLTNALVRYGIEDLSQASQPSKRFGRQHQVLLPMLKPDTTYRFTVVSNDLFRRKQVSEPLTFSTSKTFTSTRQQNSNKPPGSEGQIGMVCSFKRIDAYFLLDLKLEQPASVFIGSFEREGLPDDEFHAGLNSRLESSLQACLSCHQAHPHPVNVSPTKPGIIIPSEFPTLPDGRITCSSCHAPHGSDYYFFTRKSEMNELCVSCHQKWDTMRKNNIRKKN